MKIAIVGCGYVFDHYMETLADHPILELTGVFDRDEARLGVVAKYFGLYTYDSLEQLLADPAVELIVNLTDPDNHYPVSKAALTAGKHVYSEKPLATHLDLAKELFDLAARKGLLLSSAPCSALSEADVLNILAAQASRDKRLKAADLVIDNTDLSLSTLANLSQQVARQFGLSSQ